MKIQDKPLERRDFLRGAFATALTIPLGITLASCATGGGTTTNNAPGGKKTEKNPFGLAATSTVDAVIFNGGYGIDYAEFAGQAGRGLPEGHHGQGLAADEHRADPAAALRGGQPAGRHRQQRREPDRHQHHPRPARDLDDVINATNYEGKVIKDTLYSGVIEPGTFDGKFVQLNYALTVYALWYSASLFEENGWTVPKT